MESKKGIEREWIQWIAGHFPEILPFPPYCSVPHCERKPTYVLITKYTYFLCDECKRLVDFEKSYAAKKEKK